MVSSGAIAPTRILLYAFLLGICFPAMAEDVTGDPLEGFNRRVYAFNEGADKFLLRPLAVTYRFVLPDPVESAVGRVFDNLGELVNITNDVLQWKWKQAGNDTGRFLVNSTLGVGGVFDVARHMGLQRNEGEDFGQTLARWGVDGGAYLVLPFIGPSTLRDAPAAYLDSFLRPVRYIDHIPTRNTITAVDVISIRADLIKSESLLSGDRYLFVRDVYLQRRLHLINDGKVEDDFGSFDDYGDY